MDTLLPLVGLLLSWASICVMAFAMVRFMSGRYLVGLGLVFVSLGLLVGGALAWPA